jgi:hypothetical protein
VSGRICESPPLAQNPWKCAATLTQSPPDSRKNLLVKPFFPSGFRNHCRVEFPNAIPAANRTL